MSIEVIRLGHRPDRDKRTTTHICLVARALGADAVHIVGEAGGAIETLDDIKYRFGGEIDRRSAIGSKFSGMGASVGFGSAYSGAGEEGL